MADDGPAGLDGVRVVPLPAHVDVSNAMSVHAALEAELRAGVTDLAATASLGLEGLQVLLLTRAAAARQRGQAAAGGRAARRAEVHERHRGWIPVYCRQRWFRPPLDPRAELQAHRLHMAMTPHD